MKIPEIINNYKVYSPDSSGAEETLVGVGEEVECPDVEAIETTVKGAGMLGEYNGPTLSQFSAMKMEIPFRVFYGDFTRYAQIGKAVKFIIRASIQGLDTETAESTTAGIKISVKGKVSKIKSGTVKQGEVMDCSCTINPFYYCVESSEDGQTYKKMLELDVFSEVYVVEGVDMLTDINKYL